MAADAFTITGKIAVDFSTASADLDAIMKSADKTADHFDDVESAADDMGDAIDDAGDDVDDADGKFDAWGVTLGNLAAQAISKVIDKCVELGEKIIDLGIDTETSFAKLETIAGVENIDALSESISELSKETGVSSAELANVAYNAISAGASAETAMDMVTAATKLGVAGFTDADSALSVLSTAMNSYGDSCGTVEEVSDSLIMVQNLGVTTVEELAANMGKAIATGSAYSVSLGNLESAYVSVTKSGISTAEGTTYINSMLNELGDSGSDVSGILQEQTGKSFTQLMEDGYSLSDVLGVLYDSVGSDSTALMNLWSSAEAGKASNAIVNQGLEEFNTNLESITGSTGATEAAYGTMTDTMETKIAIMKTNFEELGLKIYDGLEGPLSGAVSFITDSVIPGIESLIDFFDKYGAIMVGAATSIGVFVVALNFSSIVSTVTGVLGGLQGAIVKVNTAMMTNPIVLVVALIAGLIAALVYLWNTNDGFREGVTAAWEAIKSAIGAVIEGISSALSAAWEFIKGVIDSIVDGFQGVWETLGGIFDSIVEALQTAWDTICNVIQVAIMLIGSILDAAFQIITLPFQFIWENCKDIIMDVWDAISGTISSALDAISGVITSVWEAVSGFISGVMETISGIFTAYWEAISSIVSTVMEAIKSVITTVLDTIKSVFSTVFNAIKTVVSTVLNSIKSTFSSIWNSIKTVVSTAVNSVKSVISTALNGAFSTVTNILTKIKEKFSSIFDSVKTTVSNAIEKIKSYFNFEWSLPKLKMPHFSISGSFSLNPPSVPSFGIEWYKKAMEGGMIMNSPTVFGYDAESNNLLAGGEAGSETVVGTESLMSMITTAVSANNAEIVGVLESILDVLKEILGQPGGDIVIPVSIGNESIDEIVLNAKERISRRSGGKAYA